MIARAAVLLIPLLLLGACASVAPFRKIRRGNVVCLVWIDAI